MRTVHHYTHNTGLTSLYTSFSTSVISFLITPLYGGSKSSRSGKGCNLGSGHCGLSNAKKIWKFERTKVTATRPKRKYNIINCVK